MKIATRFSLLYCLKWSNENNPYHDHSSWNSPETLPWCTVLTPCRRIGRTCHLLPMWYDKNNDTIYCFGYGGMVVKYQNFLPFHLSYKKQCREKSEEIWRSRVTNTPERQTVQVWVTESHTTKCSIKQRCIQEFMHPNFGINPLHSPAFSLNVASGVLSYAM